MSDRFPQYPLHNSLLQQQQQAQQQAQQQQQQQQQAQHQQLQPQSDQHAAYPDQNRMWQQQMQYRPRSGMDMNQQPQQQQQQQQIQELLRAHQQQMGQQGQPQPQPQFGLGMSAPQMSTGGPMNPQQPPFPDPSNNQSQPPHMPPAGFPNMGPMSNQNPGLPQRNPGILGVQNSGPMGRQLELMLAQQPQNGVLFNVQKMNQQNQQIQQVQQPQRDQQQPQPQLHPPGINHPNSADIFTSPALPNEALRRPSPSHPPNLAPQIPGAMQGSQQQPLPGGGVHHPVAQLRRNPPMSIQEIAERLKLVRQSIVNIEAELRSLFSQGQVTPSPELAAKIRNLQADLKNKQEIMSRLLQQQQIVAQNGGMNHMVGRLGPNGVPGQPSWPQNVPGQVFERGNAAQQQMPPSLHSQAPNGIQSNSSLQSQANLMASGGVPRPGQTPNPQGIPPTQQLGSPFPGQANIPANMGNKPPFSVGGYGPVGAASVVGMQQRPMSGVPSGYPPPLDKVKLDTMLPGFLQRKGVKIDPNLLNLNDQQIDLAHLHALVITEGGFQKVNDSEAWNVVGGRMGFVNFPGSDREPPKSGPVVAQHLAHVYREYLLDLELTYVRTWHASNQPRMGNPGAQQGNMNHPGAGGMPNGMALGVNGQPSRMSPALLPYAHMSAAELRQRGIPEHVIAVVEQNRPQLQRTALGQERFRHQVRMNVRNAPQMAGMAVDANGMQPPNQGGNMNDPNQQGPAALFRQQQLLQKQQQQQQQMMGGLQQGMQPANSLMLRPEATRMAIETINRMKEEFKKSNYLSRLVQLNVDVPFEQRAEFNQLLETAHRQCQDLNDKLHMMHLLMPGITSRAITICNIVSTQRHLLANGQPRYVVSLDHLRSLSNEVHRILETFSHQQQQIVQRTRGMQAAHQAAQQQQQQQPHQPPPQLPPQVTNQQPTIPTLSGGPHPHPQVPQVLNGVNGSAQSPPGSNMHHSSPNQQPPLQHPPPPQQQQPMSMGPQHIQQPPQAPSPSHMQPNRAPPINLHAPPPKRKNAPTPSNNNTAPSPAAAASASTPAPPNAPTPTPTAASPSAPKSPKTKPKAKQTAASKRKLSSVPNTHPSTANPPQAPEQMQPQMSSSVSGSMKRAREEDTSNGNMAPSPAGAVVDQPSPPKRAKVEWEVQPSEELQMRKSMVEGVKSEEGASEFLAQMTELFKMAGGDSQQDPEFTELTNMLLKGCTQVPGNTDDLGLNSFVTPLDPPPIPPIEDGLEQYFDFSLGATQEDGDDDSKTPELISSSTTNTSPGSNSGNESTAEGSTTAINEVKLEDSSDLTRLGSWKEIDGGESAFYQTNEWKWDSAMQTLEQPWAMFMS